MDDAQDLGTKSPQTELLEIRDHLVRAQELMDRIEPHSAFASRLQQLIDEIDGEPMAGAPIT